MAIDLGNDPGGTPPTAGEKLQIRSAIGVGTTDAPTFLAQTLTGQSLTGTQATSLVDLSTTWNTTGTPSALKLNVTDTASNAASKLMDLQVGGVSRFSVQKSGVVSFTNDVFGSYFYSGGSPTAGLFPNTVFVGNAGQIGFASGATFGGTFDTLLRQDAAGILAQRNGTAKQALRVYNTALSGAPEWAEFDWITSGGTNTLRIGTNLSGTGAARSIDFVTGGVAKWQISAAGNLIASAGDTYDIGLQDTNKPRNVFCGTSFRAPYAYVQYGNATDAGLYFAGNNTSTTWVGMIARSSGVITIGNGVMGDFGRLQLGGTTDSFPAIARDGAGTKFTGGAAGSTSWIKVPAVAVSALPAAATAGVGARAFVNDALTPVFGSAVANGGSATVPVYSTGSAWNVG